VLHWLRLFWKKLVTASVTCSTLTTKFFDCDLAVVVFISSDAVHAIITQPFVLVIELLRVPTNRPFIFCAHFVLLKDDSSEPTLKVVG
jgi:hypothetical protein